MIQKLINNNVPAYEILDYITVPYRSMINTHENVDYNTVVEIIADVAVQSSGSKRLFSTYAPGYLWNSSKTWQLETSNSIWFYPLGYTSCLNAGVSPSDFQRKKLRYNVTASGYLTVYDTSDNVVITQDVSQYSSSTETSENIRLFGFTGTHEYLASGSKIYDVKIWQGNTLTHHYLPAKRLSDNVYGLYDEADNTFHPNEVSGYSFTGTSKTTPEYIYDNQTQTLYVNDIILPGSPTVEHKYELLDYIITPAASEINTNVTVDGTTVVEMTAQINTSYRQGSPRFFSTNDTDTDTPGWGEPGTWGLQLEEYGSILAIKILGASQSIQQTDITFSDLLSRKLRYNLTSSGYLNIYDDTNTLYKTYDVSSLTNINQTSSSPIKLFHRYTNKEYINEGTYIYTIKIWKQNVLVRDYVPAKRLSDNVYGLYDLENDTFHPNEVSGYSFTGVSKSVPEYIDETVSNLYHINRIYLGGSIYWGNAPETVPHHEIEGTLSSSFNSIYFNRQVLAPGSSYFTGGYTVQVNVDNNDWYVDTNDKPQTLVGCFANNNNITSVSIYNLDCTNLNSIENMFEYCQFMTSCDVSRLDTSNVTVMGNVFGHCTRLTSVDVSSWDVSKVTRIWGMFRDLNAMTSIDLSGCNFSSVLTAMDHLFYNSRSLETIDLSNQNFSGVTSMNYVFYNCTGLKTLYLLDMQVHSGLTFGTSMWSGCNPTDVYINSSTVLNRFTNNLSSQGQRYIPSFATIHYNGTDYKWQNNAWTPQN